MLKNGWIGRKGPSGFYKMRKDGAARIKESIDLKDATYHTSVKASLESVDGAKKGGLKALVQHADKGGQFARRRASQGLTYAASLVPEITDTIVGVDEAMKDGYGWGKGPFELIDDMGAKWFADKLTAEKRAVPALVKLAAEKGGFYKIDGRKLLYLTTKGDYAEVVRATGTMFGHTLETQFPLGLALAALSLSRGALFPPNDPSGFEVEKAGSPDQIVVVGAGHWQGEGMALVEAVK